jgi:hypothetical protein
MIGRHVLDRRTFSFLLLWLLWAAAASAGAQKLGRFIASGRCGFEDPAGATVIEPHFENCGDFSEGLAAVQIDGQWGYIDERGKLAIPSQFAAADEFSEGLAFVELASGTKAVIDQQGNVLFEADYYQHGRFREGLAPVLPATHWHCWACGDDEESTGPHPPEECPANQVGTFDFDWGYIDRTGKMAIPPQFLMAEEFHEGLARERDGFIDHNGVEVIKSSFATDFSEGLAAVHEGDEWGYINKQGALVVPLQYESAAPMSEGRGLVKKDGKYGFVDSSGNLSIPTEYDNARSFSEGLAAVEREDKWGYIDREGSVAIPFRFDSAQRFQHGQAAVSAGTDVFLIDTSGGTLKSQTLSLSRTIRQLQAFEVKPSNFRSSEGPLDAVVPLMTIYKKQLRTLVADKLKEPGVARAPAATIKSAIERELERAGARHSKQDQPETRPYGLLPAVEVFRPKLQPRLLVVIFHLSLANETDDGSLSVYRQTAGDWETIYRADHDNYYSSEMDAYDIATPEFSETDRQGAFLMLLASHSGYSGDGSYGLAVQLLRFDSSLHHHALFQQEFGGKGHQIAMEPGGFRLEMLSFESDLARGGCRVYPYRYEVAGDTVRRIVPIAFDAHDFVEEWGNLPWNEAVRWSASGRREELHTLHDRYFDRDETSIGEYPETRSCGGNVWQVEYVPSYASDGTETDDVFFVVRQLDQWTFIMTGVRSTPLQGCTAVPEPRSFSTMFDKPLEW